MPERQGFDRIIGQEVAKHVLARAVQTGKPAHAYLFVGLQGIGKATTALEFAKALNCEEPLDFNACGQCATCRAIEHGNFPDIRVWSPDSPSGQDTTIKAMQEMRDLANFAPLRGKWKVNIIEQGDTLNLDSANCILKLLEEPPGYLVNILVYHNVANVLPTIRSRCQLVRFTQVNAAELAQRLVEEHDVAEEQAQFLAAYSQGRPGHAIGLIGESDFFARRDAIIAAVTANTASRPWLALKLAEVLRDGAAAVVDDSEDEEASEGPAPAKRPRRKQRDIMLESLDILVTWYRDLLAAKLQGPDAALVNLDKADAIAREAARFPHAGKLLAAVEAVVDARRAVSGNANPQMTSESLMMSLTA